MNFCSDNDGFIERDYNKGNSNVMKYGMLSRNSKNRHYYPLFYVDGDSRFSLPSSKLKAEYTFIDI